MKKIFIACSKWCYKYIPDVKKALELMNYEVILPNYYDTPMIEEEIKMKDSTVSHQEFCKNSFQLSRKKAEESDAILVLNLDKVKDGIIYPNYIGGATFLEIYDSYILGHDIFLYNEIPDGILKDEIEGMCPNILDGDLLKIRSHYKTLQK